MGYPGITLRFRYVGLSPTLKLNAASADCFFNLSVNDWPSAVLRLEAGENMIDLPAGSAPAEGWEVKLVRRTEAWQGLVTFEGLVLPDSETEVIAPSPGPNRRNW
ncbi:MAG: hypothetical protein J6386_23875 [Candidatus Synoicihabitans palmerolidicus]|nr:hypothetical protein [Candidatus Synoicihabitans palmerolidicus]